MTNKTNELHITLDFTDFHFEKNSQVKLYKIFNSQRSSISSVSPEVMIAVIAGGSLVIRQFIASLFDYLKSKEATVLRIEFSNKSYELKKKDIDDEDKMNEIIDLFKSEEKKVSIYKLAKK